VFQIIRLLPGRTQTGEGLAVDRRTAPRAPLVEQKDAKLLHSPLQPATGCQGTGCAKARSALQEEQPGQIVFLLLRADHLPAIDRKRGAVGSSVIQRHIEPVIDEDKARQAVS